MRVLIVSNRLPVTAIQDDKGFHLRPNLGSLTTSINSFLKSQETFSSNYLWFGSAGNIRPENYQDLKHALAPNFLIPIPSKMNQTEEFYDSFCNQTIWPLFHYFPSKALYDSEHWQSYIEMNESFCNAISKELCPGDLVWIHDFHLMLLPQMLRNVAPQTKIGFFLNIPFPAFEIFRLLPWSLEILTGLLGSDLVGFHTDGFLRSFVRCMTRILGHKISNYEIFLSDRGVKTGTFPMGIDFQRFNDSSIQPDTISVVNEMKKHLADKKIILSVDRIDYSKGILNKLLSFEKFLESNPDWHRKVILYLVVAPSHGKIDQHLAMKKKIDQAVGHINGRFGQFDWNPVLYQYQFLSFENLSALFANSDVFLVTPFREGMNLAAKEYIASKRDKTGVLILSEMAGAAKELTDAIIVNPNDVNAMVSAINDALLMPIHEQIVKNEKMQFHLKSNDVVHWASSFLRILNSNHDQKKTSCKLPEILNTKSEIRQQFFNAERRLILLDYDGTLVPFSEKPELATPSKRVKRILHSLAGADKTDVVLVSGRPKKFMDKFFSDLLINIIAEHGAWGRKIYETWQLLDQFDSSWKVEVNFLLSEYVLKLPGSFVEEKDYAIVFHYRSADPDLAAIILPELKTALDSMIDHSLLEILEGKKILEILCSNSGKGKGISNFLSDNYWPLILAFGDDRTDEDMFGKLPKHSVSVKVGPSENSTAKYQIKNPKEVLDFLEYLLDGEKL